MAGQVGRDVKNPGRAAFMRGLAGQVAGLGAGLVYLDALGGPGPARDAALAAALASCGDDALSLDLSGEGRVPVPHEIADGFGLSFRPRSDGDMTGSGCLLRKRSRKSPGSWAGSP